MIIRGERLTWGGGSGGRDSLSDAMMERKGD